MSTKLHLPFEKRQMQRRLPQRNVDGASVYASHTLTLHNGRRLLGSAMTRPPPEQQFEPQEPRAGDSATLPHLVGPSRRTPARRDQLLRPSSAQAGPPPPFAYGDESMLPQATRVKASPRGYPPLS